MPISRLRALSSFGFCVATHSQPLLVFPAFPGFPNAAKAVTYSQEDTVNHSDGFSLN
jgi:hypothetical protein